MYSAKIKSLVQYKKKTFKKRIQTTLAHWSKYILDSSTSAESWWTRFCSLYFAGGKNLASECKSKKKILFDCIHMLDSCFRPGVFIQANITAFNTFYRPDSHAQQSAFWHKSSKDVSLCLCFLCLSNLSLAKSILSSLQVRLQTDPFIPKEVPCAPVQQHDRQKLGGMPMASPQSHLPLIILLASATADYLHGNKRRLDALANCWQPWQKHV